MPIINDELVGGSEGEMERGMSLPFFHPGVKAIKFAAKNVYGCRILPAFDRTLKGQEGFKTSFVPYRRTDSADPNTGYGTFSDWFYPVQVYQFLGNEGRGFVSPLTKEKKPARGYDPIYNCWLTARNSDNADWKELVAKGATKAEGFDATLPKPREMGFLNVYMAVKEGEEMSNFVGVVNYSAIQELKALLNMLRPAVVQEIISPAWPDFLYGDVTDPITGLWSIVKKQLFNTAGMGTSCFTFSNQKDVLRGHQSWPIDPATEWGQGVLAGRYTIGDMGKVTKIPSAEEILDWVVADGFLPYELVEHACKEKWAVPAEHGNRTYSQPDGYVTEGGAFESADPAEVITTSAPSPSGPPALVGVRQPYRPPAVKAPSGAPSSPSAPPAATVAAPSPGAPPPQRAAGPGAPPLQHRAGASGASGPRPAATAPGGPPPRPQSHPVERSAPAVPSPQPVSQPTPSPAQALPMGANVPLTPEEIAEWRLLEKRWEEGGPNSLAGPGVTRLMELGNRASMSRAGNPD